MYERKSRVFGAFMIAVSILLRLSMALELDAGAAAAVTQTASNRDFARFLLYLETGEVTTAPEPANEPDILLLEKTAPEPPVPEPAQQVPDLPLPEALADSSQLSISGGCTYSVDKETLLHRPSSLDFSGTDPQILIVHTHGSEAYLQQSDAAYIEAGSFRTLETDKSVIRVGEVLAETLTSYGLSVLHDTTVNDYPSYDTSYYNTLQRIEDWKQEYPGLQMVLDIHRDAVSDESGGPVALSAQLEGEHHARLMLVVGTDQGGLSHPDWEENLANALKLQSVLEGLYPGLCRDLDLRTERFNQHMTPGSLLVEVGTNGNTLEQAERSARLLGDALASMIGSLNAHNGLLQTGKSGNSG